jgi:putative flippase GtrA
MNFLRSMLSETGGTVSTTRVSLFLVVMGVVGVLVYSVVHAFLNKAPFVLDQGVSTLASATVASLSAAKAWQKSSEAQP